ncbi:MAG TPA: STAS domain-containing protein [Rhodocyclaceae bacterium]|nr:STAS domain-containing protein [Rhodocyclaceae bacterium]
MICESTTTEDVLAAQDGKLTILTPMRMDSAAAVLAAAQSYVLAGDCVLDFVQVPAVDSAALSVVLSLLRAARAADHRLSLVNVPAAFGSLAALYGVDDLFSEHLHVSMSDAHA